MSLETLTSDMTSRMMLFAHPIHPCKHEIENVFVRYMEVCALEKRGPHTLGYTHDDDTKHRAAPGDIALLKSFADMALADVRHGGGDDRAASILRSAAAATTANVCVHLTRDYQVIETGNHYVKLSFCVRTPVHIDRITFTTRFSVETDYATHHLRELSVCYARDGNDILRVGVDPQSRLIMNMPTKHLLDADYVPIVDRTVEACCIC
jgi:hypothetical protein